MKLWKWVESFGELFGLILFVLVYLLRLASGMLLDDLIFDKVVNIVDISLFLRPHASLVLYSSLILMVILFTILIRQGLGSLTFSIQFKIQILLRILTGWLIGESLIFFLINSIFYRGAIQVYPYLIGFFLLLLVALSGLVDANLRDPINQIRSRTGWQKASLLYRLTKYFLILTLALIMIVPAMVPLSGFQASPPGLPQPYGGKSGPYDVEKIQLQQEVPDNISSFLIPDNANSSWYIYLYLPRIPSAVNHTAPVVLFAHGYTGTDPADYENSLYQLASRGSVVIFVQYVTLVKQLTGQFAEPEDTPFIASNAMYFRYLMEWNGIMQAVNYLQTDTNQQISTHYIQIIGHSVGGGMVPYLATKVIQQGWATGQLLLDMEMPWFASTHPLTTYNLSILPATTIVNIVGAQDDHLASPCIGMQHFERFYGNLSNAAISYLIVPSDFHGFPRMVATHYLVTSAIDDTLTKWGFLKRVDAMSAYLVDLVNNLTVDQTLSYFTDGTYKMLTQGNWSDGTPVNPLTYSTDPYGIRGGQNLANTYLHSHDMGPEVCTIG